MLAMPGLRAFSLSPNRDGARISCGPLGAVVGDVALLKRMQSADETGAWTARPVAELNSELTARYRLPIDVSSKTCAFGADRECAQSRRSRHGGDNDRADAIPRSASIGKGSRGR